MAHSFALFLCYRWSSQKSNQQWQRWYGWAINRHTTTLIPSYLTIQTVEHNILRRWLEIQLWENITLQFYFMSHFSEETVFCLFYFIVDLGFSAKFWFRCQWAHLPQHIHTHCRWSWCKYQIHYPSYVHVLVSLHVSKQRIQITMRQASLSIQDIKYYLFSPYCY